MPSNSIAFARNYTSVIDEVYQRASVSGVLNSGRRMVRAGHNAKEILIPKISVTGLGNYTRNVGYKTGAITYEFETKTFNYDRGIRLFADVMDVEEAGVNDCFVEAGAELQRTQVASEADAFTFAQIAGHTGVTVTPEDLSEATATDILQALREVTSAMDEKQVTLGSRYLFITPRLKGVLDDFSYANPTMSNRVLERFARVIEVPQVRFYTKIDLKSGDTEFGYAKAAAGKAINFMVVEKSAVIKFDKHVASRVFSPDELESLDSYMMKYRKYGIVELFANVRFERTQKVSDDEHRSADAGQGTVFVDAVNSIGAFDVPAGSRVAVSGHSMMVAESHACCDLFGRVHHWELKVR